MMDVYLTQALDRRLSNWAFWLISFKKNEVGFPAKSTVADFGLSDSHVRQSKPPFPLNNLEADEMNGWINIMGTYNPAYKNVIGAYYLRQDSLKISDLAAIQKINESLFKQRLNLARIWLKGCLVTKEDKLTGKYSY